MFYIIAILALCVLIFVHELGHFLLAKYNKVGVLAFSIGFGPVIWKKTIGETTYAIRALPLGGYVRMIGDDPRWLNVNPEKLFEEVSEKNDSLLEDAGLSDLTPEQRAMLGKKDRWFLTRPYWQKFWIVFAGPLFNYVFAILMAIGSIWIFGAASPINEPIIGDVLTGLPAEEAGIHALDKIVAIDGKELKNWEELAQTVRSSGGKEMLFDIRRGEEKVESLQLKVTAEADTAGLASAEDRAAGDIWRIGIAPHTTREAVGFIDACKAGTSFVWHISTLTIDGLKGLVTRNISSEHIAGPLRIIGEAGKSAEKGVDSLIGFMVFLSVTLALLNLLPIPVLDGGHIVFFTIEAFKGSPMSLKVREISNQVGIALLLLLMVVAFSNDIGHYFF